MPSTQQSNSSRKAGRPKADGDTPQISDPVNRRPLHLRFSCILLVMVGGTLGTLARYGVDLVLPSPNGWPLPTLTVNICGAFGLGLLLEALARQGNETGQRRIFRLLAGTGFLGAFTTYSALTLEAVQLLLDGRAAEATSYLAVTLLGGIAASWFGILLGASRRPRSDSHSREIIQ